MPEEVATYLNQRTNTLAQVVKALQGSRPSDFDWKKLEVLFPGVLDSKELARADFEAIERMMETAALAEIGQGTEAGDKAFAELTALGNALQNIYGKSSDSALGEYTEGKGWSWRDKMTPDQIDAFRALLKEQGQGERGLSGLLTGKLSVARKPSIQCPGCGLGLEELRRQGRVGCEQCYQAFDAYLSESLERLHGASRHVGRLPGLPEGELERRQQVEGLKGELQDAVREEDYERAADLRDEIQALESGAG